MTVRFKDNITTATNVLVLIGLIAGGVFFFTDVRETNATQDEKILTLQQATAENQSQLKQLQDVLILQGKDVAIIKYYFDNGLLGRLQLEYLKQTVPSELISHK